MTICNILRNWGHQPDILCDHCGTPIRYPDEPGYVLWKDWNGQYEDAVNLPEPTLIIVHQARCDPGKQAGYTNSQALDEFIACLLQNTGLNQTRIQKAKRRATWMRDIG